MLHCVFEMNCRQAPDVLIYVICGTRPEKPHIHHFRSCWPSQPAFDFQGCHLALYKWYCSDMAKDASCGGPLSHCIVLSKWIANWRPAC